MIIKASALWGDFMKRFIIGFSKNESGRPLSICFTGDSSNRHRSPAIDAGLAYAARAGRRMPMQRHLQVHKIYQVLKPP